MNPYRHFIGEIEAALRALQAAGELPAGLDFSAALESGGFVRAWGRHTNGRLGVGTVDILLFLPA